MAGGSNILRREEDFLKGMHVSMPKKRDNKDRPANIPESIVKGEKKELNRPTLKQIQEECGGAGVFNFPLQGIKPFFDFCVNKVKTRTFLAGGP